MAKVQVAPFTGAWIEILMLAIPKAPFAVAPFTGAWIEISGIVILSSDIIVAPFTGAWIEIRRWLSPLRRQRSLPSRERGLKSDITPGVGNEKSRSLHGSVD